MYFPAALSTCNSSAVLPKLCIGLFHNRQEKPWLSINFHYSISTIWHKISKAGNQLRVCSLQLLVYVKNICSTRKSFGKMWNLTIITSSSIITQKRKNINHVSESTRKNSTNSGTRACMHIHKKKKLQWQYLNCPANNLQLTIQIQSIPCIFKACKLQSCNSPN